MKYRHSAVHEAGAELRLFGEQIVGESNITLETLRNIETTVRVLQWFRQRCEADGAYCMKLLERLEKCRDEVELDPEDTITDAYGRALDAVKAIFLELQAKLGHARTAPDLADDEHRENVVSEYEQTIDCMRHFYDTLQDLRWSIMNHDGRASGSAAAFSNPDELRAYLAKL